MFRTALLIASLLMFSASAHSDNTRLFEYLKVDDFPALDMYVSASAECPFTSDDLWAKVEGELLRARLEYEPLANRNITIRARCIAIEQGSATLGHAIFLSIRYGHDLFVYDRELGNLYIYSKSTSPSKVLSDFSDRVTDALTLYLKANLDG